MTEHERGGSDWRAVVDRTVTEYRSRTRAIAARLSASGQARPERTHHEEHDNDGVESWMADPRGPAPDRERPAGTDVLDRIDHGELAWDDVLSGRADDRESASLRAFLAERAAEIRVAREARR